MVQEEMWIDRFELEDPLIPAQEIEPTLTLPVKKINSTSLAAHFPEFANGMARYRRAFATRLLSLLLSVTRHGNNEFTIIK